MFKAHSGSAATEAASIDFLKSALLAAPREAHAHVLTGALYGVVRMMHASRPAAMSPEELALSILASASFASSRVEPSVELTAAADDEEAYLQMMGEAAARMVQTVADTLHRVGAGGPCCPMGGVVPGLIAGAVFSGIEALPPGTPPTVPLFRESVLKIVDEAITESARANDDDVGEVAGHA